MGGPLGRTSRSTCCVVDEDAQGDAGDGGARTDVVGPLTNDNSVALLLTYGTARVRRAGDAAAMGWLREHA
jgi:hypothetical protein